MKNYDDLTNRLLERRDRYVATQQKKRKMMLRVSASVGCAAVVALAGVGLVRSGVFDQTPPVTNAVVKTTTVTTAPTEQDVTTTTANAPTTETTTDGGVVAPTTTVTTAPTEQDVTTTTATVDTPTTETTTTPTQTTITTVAPTTGKTKPTTICPTTSQMAPTTSQTVPTSSQTTATQTTATTSSTATQTKPTQTTGTTQTTTPPVEDDYIVVDPPIGSGEPMPIYTMSVKVPARCSVTDEYVTVELSYGVPLLGMSPDNITATGYVELSLGHKKQKVAVLKVIDIKEMFTPQYDVEIPLDEDGWPTAFIYAHTETIQVPLSICSDRTGYIQFSLQDYTYEDNEFIFGGGGVSVWYTRMGGDIVFRSDIYWG